MLRLANKLAVIGESLEEEAIHPNVNEYDLYLPQGPTKRRIGPISGSRLSPDTRDQ